MRKLAIAAAVSVSLASVSSETIALDLGEIEIFSALNQNLDAEINLVSVSPGELSSVSVRLAEDSAFTRAGLQLTPALRGLRFNVEQRPDGATIVKVYSDAPVVEPFLNFLVTAESSSTPSQSREYTILLDPPGFALQQQPIDADPVAGLSSTEADPTVIDSPVAGLSSASVVELDTDPVADSGAQSGAEVDLSAIVDLSDVDADGAGSTVIFTEQRADELAADTASDSASTDLPIAVTLPLTDARPANVEQEIDLGGGLVDAADTAVDDQAGSVDVALDGLAAENAIFSGESGAREDDLEAVVDLGEFAGEGGGDALVNNGNSVVEAVRQRGVAISLEALDTGASGGDIADPGVDDFIPQVTLEPVDVGSLPRSESVTDSVVVPEQSPQVLGLDIDLSGIVGSDTSLLFEQAEQSSPDAGGGDLSLASLAGLETSDALVTSADSQTYRVQREDTLWSISRRQKPSGVSTNQMMRAIVEANPRAFVNGDMNTLREGVVLTIPGGTGAPSSSNVAVADSAAGQTATPAIEVSRESSLPGVVPLAGTDDVRDTPAATISTDLDEVNKKMLLAQEELTAEAQQRDELSNRVVELEDNLTKMKELITLRESELNELETELVAPAAVVDLSSDESASTEQNLAMSAGDAVDVDDEEVRELQDQINENTALAQERVDAQADADRNLASAQAQVKSLQLANEEDALRQQLAQLRMEKAELEQTAQADKLELVRQAELEKAQLLENASAERERILASLDEEKQRIADEAAAERARIAAEAEAEKERLIAEVKAERDQLAAESEAMRSKLEVLEAENSELAAQAGAEREQREAASLAAEEEQARLLAQAEAEKQSLEEESTRVKDKLAELQAEANANLAGSQNVDRTNSDSDADGSSVVDLAVPALVGGGVAAAPLERQVGDRKKVLAIGGGVALLGLLGAWAVRRRKVPPVAPRAMARTEEDRTDLNFEEVSLAEPAPGRFNDQGDDHRTDADGERPKMGQVAVVASAAAAVAAAAKNASNKSETVEPDIELGNVEEVRKPAPPVESVRVDETDHTEDTPPVVEEALVEEALVDDTDHAEHTPPMVEEVLVDDTLTEADVYLRYGLHGQAEDLLKSAIEGAPDVPEYQAKLMESYHDQKNTDAFSAAAATFKDRFGESAPQWERISEMGRNLDSSDTTYSRAGALGAAAVVGAAVSGEGANAGGNTEQTAADVDAGSAASLDDTIDASEDFSMADLEATGDLSAIAGSLPDDLDDISLDEVDMAALDDDGTLNLEELTGDQMSGLDLGTLDLTNPEGDSTLDNLTLDDADLNSLGDVTSGVRDGLSTDIGLDDGAISRTDEMETMLDLAKAYIDMGDSDSAQSALNDIITHGSEAQKMEAQDLLSKLR